ECLKNQSTPCAFDALEPAPAGARWARKMDEGLTACTRETIVSETHRAIEGGYATVLWKLDARTGRTRFMVDLGGDDRIDWPQSSLVLDPAGRPILVLEIKRAGARAYEQRLFVFDPESGEVVEDQPLALTQKSVTASLVAAHADGFVLAGGELVW